MMATTLTNYSRVTLPIGEKRYPTILAFLVARFPRVMPSVWEQRVLQGKVLDENGTAVSPASCYAPGRRITYFREVEQEPVIPFEEAILFQNDDLLVACKPHFLPVNPTGPFVQECLVNRLRKRTGNYDLVPINRIDRETAGLVMFSANPETRDSYYQLFRAGKVSKGYEAVAEFGGSSGATEWSVENRIVSGEPWFRMKVEPGEPNARSAIRLAGMRGKRARFVLSPLTGKTHQLRLHMSGLGFPILNDRYYPELQPQSEDDFENPLQLLAKRVGFKDPITSKEMMFVSPRTLMSWEE